MSKECLQDQTGCCGGCNVVEIANNQLHGSGSQRDKEVIEEARLKAQKKYCPPGRTMQTRWLKQPKQTIW